MRLLFLLLFLCKSAFSESATDSLIYVDSVPYKLHFSDEFEGTEIDRTKWATYNHHTFYDSVQNKWVSDDKDPASRLFSDYAEKAPSSNQVFTDSNVVVSQGTCKIYTHKEPAEWMGYTRSYSSGVLNSQDVFFSAGVYDIKLRFAPAYLYTYAFWLYGVVATDEVVVSSEVDIFEFFNKNKYKFESNLHKWRNHKIISSAHGESKVKTEDWHTYRCVYDDFAVRIFLDDMRTPLFTFYKFYNSETQEDISYHNKSQIPQKLWVEHTYFPDPKQYTRLILNGGTTRSKSMKRKNQWTHKKTPDQGVMEVDYIRYYKLVDAQKN